MGWSYGRLVNCRKTQLISIQIIYQEPEVETSGSCFIVTWTPAMCLPSLELFSLSLAWLGAECLIRSGMIRKTGHIIHRPSSKCLKTCRTVPKMAQNERISVPSIIKSAIFLPDANWYVFGTLLVNFLQYLGFIEKTGRWSSPYVCVHARSTRCSPLRKLKKRKNYKKKKNVTKSVYLWRNHGIIKFVNVCFSIFYIVSDTDSRTLLP